MLKVTKNYCEMFVGAILLIGGIISILIPVAELENRFLATIIIGITLVMLGTVFIWKATESFRERQRQQKSNNFEGS